ncbi:LytR/AlgR family response regulator transcription factor [Mangrovimonas xylaniphaga]|uniref:LytR/AlgR family response regulator transcription factor n=1 Tax=Mangrovimonas xylaniphaga TaxID=1645915 RepID=UPI0006B6201B|nr:response regulator transcription factor [Mangrovimonas xylaniphaga]
MHKKLKVLIVEDEELQANLILEILKSEGYFNIQITHNVQDTLMAFKTFNPEIVLLDINLQGKNDGIALSKEKNKDAQVIFISAQNDLQTITLALKTKPEAYFSKPIKKPDLLAAINLCFIKSKKETIKIKNGYIEEIIPLNDILYLVSDRNYIDIITTNNKFTLRSSLSQFLKHELPKDRFVQIHRSIVVNKTKINKKGASWIEVNNQELPISRNYQFSL